MIEYADINDQESNSSYDNKKILKIFFRWFKLGSREYKELEILKRPNTSNYTRSKTR